MTKYRKSHTVYVSNENFIYKVEITCNLRIEVPFTHSVYRSVKSILIQSTFVIFKHCLVFFLVYI